MAHRVVKRPALSVVVVARNAERSIMRAAESILGSEDDVQLVVADCASTDRTVAMCQSVAERDIRLDIIELDEADRALAFDRAMEAVRASHVLILGQEDWLAPKALSSLVEAVRCDPVQLGMLTVSFDRDYETGERVSHVLRYQIDPMRTTDAFRDRAATFIADGVLSMMRGKVIDRDRADVLGLRMKICGTAVAYLTSYVEELKSAAVYAQAVYHAHYTNAALEPDTMSYQRCEHNHASLLKLLSAWHREHDAQLLMAVHRLHLRELISCIEGICSLRDISTIERNDRVRDMIEAASTRASIEYLGDASREFGIIYVAMVRKNVTACCLSARIAQFTRGYRLPFLTRQTALLGYA